MASIIPGFEYDIFISYRHKDNKGDHWVTDFVTALKTEVESTFKEDISIYFDANPHDGLLESHNVDKSLEAKLKCLIFIPIISQTYCDAKSFAWQHEFCVFNRLAREDQFGRDIKLNSGNVTSRILPVRIHDLDVEDKATIENEIGGVLRSIDFIYKEPGVNRPLKSTDDRHDNLNRTDYRNQVNKVSNAIKEIVASIKNPIAKGPARDIPPVATKPTWSRKGLFTLSTTIILLSLTGYFVSPLLFSTNNNADSTGNNSVAVIPFDNLSAKSDEYLSEGITDQLTTSLGHIKELKVASQTSVNRFKKSSLTIAAIADELKVGYILEGSVQKVGEQLKVSVRLIRANDNFQKWNETYVRSFKDIISIQNDISQKVAESLGQVLKLSMLKEDKPNNTEAYDHFLRGEFLWKRVESTNIRDAISEFKQAVKLDPQFALGYTRIALGYLLLACPWGDSNLKAVLDSSIFYNELGLQISPGIPDGLYTKATIIWWAHKDFTNSENLLRQAINNDSHSNPVHLLDFGFLLNSQGRAEEGLRYCLEGSKLDPSYLASYTLLGDSYFIMKQYDKAEAKYKEGLILYPTNTDIIYRLGWLYCNTNRFQEARSFLEQKKEFFRTRDPRPQIYLAIANTKLGIKDESNLIMHNFVASQKMGVSVYDRNLYEAVYYSATSQRDKMYDALEKAVKENEIDLIWLKVDPVFEPFREEVRFKTLLRKIGYGLGP